MKYSISTNNVSLVAVCRSQEMADKYLKYKKVDERTWIEEVITDHLLASTMYGKSF